MHNLDGSSETELSVLAAENPCIGLYSEKGLHSSLKAVYAQAPGARIEVKVEARIVDVLLPEEIIEIQTRNLASISEKLLELACIMPVRVVHPIITETMIEHLNPGNGTVRQGKRAKTRRDFFSLFDELVYAPLIIASPNIRFEVLLVSVREMRIADGKGSWKRKGERTLTRELEEILSVKKLEKKEDWLELLPDAGRGLYDSVNLGTALGINTARARKVLYSFCRAGLLCQAGMEGHKKLYTLASSWNL